MHQIVMVCYDIMVIEAVPALHVVAPGIGAQTDSCDVESWCAWTKVRPDQQDQPTTPLRQDAMHKLTFTLESLVWLTEDFEGFDPSMLL